MKGFLEKYIRGKASFPLPRAVDLAKYKKPHMLTHQEADPELGGSRGPGKAQLCVEHLRSL